MAIPRQLFSQEPRRHRENLISVSPWLCGCSRRSKPAKPGANSVDSSTAPVPDSLAASVQQKGFARDEPMIPRNACSLIAALFLATWTASVGEPGDSVSLHTRRRVETPPGSGLYRVVEETRGWDAEKTAIVICYM